MLEMETMPSYSIPTLYSPPGKRKRVEEDEEEKCLDEHRVPTMVDKREEVSSLLGTHLPFSSMMRRMAAKYQRPVSPTASHLTLPLLSSPLHLSSHPYSRLIATLASSYSSSPNPKPQTTPTPPQPKRMREESPIDLSPTADSEDLLDVVSVDDDEEKKVREKEEEEEERRERAQKLQRLIAAAMFNRAGT